MLSLEVAGAGEAKGHPNLILLSVWDELLQKQAPCTSVTDKQK